MLLLLSITSLWLCAHVVVKYLSQQLVPYSCSLPIICGYKNLTENLAHYIGKDLSEELYELCNSLGWRNEGQIYDREFHNS